MPWVDGREHVLVWSYDKLPIRAMCNSVGTMNSETFLGLASCHLFLLDWRYESASHGGFTVTFRFTEGDDDLQSLDSGRVYRHTDFRQLFIEPREPWWRWVVTWTRRTRWET